MPRRTALAHLPLHRGRALLAWGASNMNSAFTPKENGDRSGRCFYVRRRAATVDSAVVQDGYQLRPSRKK
jgi:hypothetical protein